MGAETPALRSGKRKRASDEAQDAALSTRTETRKRPRKGKTIDRATLTKSISDSETYDLGGSRLQLSDAQETSAHAGNALDDVPSTLPIAAPDSHALWFDHAEPSTQVHQTNII